MALMNGRRPSHDAALDPVAISTRVAAQTAFVGTNGDDVLTGTAGNDLFKPKLGYDTVVGGDGVDKLKVDYSGLVFQNEDSVSTVDILGSGLSGHIIGGESDCTYSGLELVDLVASNSFDVFIISVFTEAAPSIDILIDGGGGLNKLLVSGQFRSVALSFEMQDDGSVKSSIGEFRRFADFEFRLGYSNDTVSGIDGILWGGGGDDVLGGGAESSTLRGDGGADVLSGGRGADTFEYIARGDSGRNPGIDVITDFSHAEGDRIVLAFDADKLVRKDQDFTFIGTAAFSGAAGELRFTDNGDGSYTVEGNLDASLSAEFVLTVQAEAPLVATDFVL